MRSTRAACRPSTSSAIAVRWLPRFLYVTLEDGRLGEAREPFLDRASTSVADAFDLDQIGDARTHDLLQVREPVDDVVRHDLGNARDLVQEPEATRLECLVDSEVAGKVQHVGDLAQVEKRLGIELGQAAHDVDELPVG